MIIHMKQKTLLMGILLTVSGMAAAQNDGGISAQMLQQLEKAHAATPQQKALFNAIAANPIDDLTKNFANQGAFDTSFSVCYAPTLPNGTTTLLPWSSHTTTCSSMTSWRRRT